MSSYLASLASSTTISNLGTRLNSLRRAITSGDEKDDPDNEDSSHISNVLRAYYTEKGRPFPEWLPPDPKAPVPQPRLVATQASFQQGNASAYSQPQAQYTGRGGGLGDLWGESGPAQPLQSQTTSLRSRGGSRTPVAAIGNNNNNSLRSEHHHSQTPSPNSVSRRPLPSQRGESYQSSRSSSGLSDRGASSGGSASERLRARLQGGLGSSQQNLPPERPQPQQYRSYSSDGGQGQGQGQGQGGYGPSGGSGGYKRPGGLPSGPRPGGYR